jgi:hypothetical protein
MKKITVRPMSPRPDRSPLARVISEEKRMHAVAHGRRNEFFQPFDLSVDTVEKKKVPEEKPRKTTSYSCSIL